MPSSKYDSKLQQKKKKEFYNIHTVKEEKLNDRETSVCGLYGSYGSTATKLRHQVYFGQRMNDIRYTCKAWRA